MTGRAKPIRLMVVGANFGRKYGAGVYRENVRRVVRKLTTEQHYALITQEVDEEPDPANEHRQLRHELPRGVRRVYWHSREPIVLSSTFKVKRRRQVPIMGSGVDIGGPAGTGPARDMTTCVAECAAGDLWFAGWHPHRSGISPKVDDAREVGADKARHALTRLSGAYGGTSGVYETDYNARRMPRMIPGEEVAHQRGLDHMRYLEHDDGVRLRLLDHGALVGTIDPHYPLWSLFEVSAR